MRYTSLESSEQQGFGTIESTFGNSLVQIRKFSFFWDFGTRAFWDNLRLLLVTLHPVIREFCVLSHKELDSIMVKGRE